MSAFLMLHGSWHQGACFGAFADRLAARGHAVWCPNLSGHGCRRDGTGPVRSMEHYTASAAAFLKAAAEPVVLVGHSMGAVSAMFLAGRYPDRVARLVYIAGFVGAPGGTAAEKIASPISTGAAELADYYRIISRQGDWIHLDLNEAAAISATFYNDCAEADAEAALALLDPVTPATPNDWAIETADDRADLIPRRYIECAADRAIPLALQRAMHREHRVADVRTLLTGHSPFISAPDALLEAVL